MLALLRTRRWIGFTVLVIVVIVAFGILSRWQWARADEKRQERVASAAAMQTRAEAVETLLPGNTPAVPEWRRAAATGLWRADQQVLVRTRPLNSTNGMWVMTPLQLADGRILWANRGWIAATGAATAEVTAPAPAPGQVTVEGYLRPFEDVPAQGGLPAGQVSAPSRSALPAVGTLVPEYLQVDRPSQEGLTALSGPEIDEGRNVSYAIQWILFALVAIAGWAFLLRREARGEGA